MSSPSTIPIQININSENSKIYFLLPQIDEYKVNDLLNDLNRIYGKKETSCFLFLSKGKEILSSEFQISKYIHSLYENESNIEIEAFMRIDEYFRILNKSNSQGQGLNQEKEKEKENSSYDEKNRLDLSNTSHLNKENELYINSQNRYGNYNKTTPMNMQMPMYNKYKEGINEDSKVNDIAVSDNLIVSSSENMKNTSTNKDSNIQFSHNQYNKKEDVLEIDNTNRDFLSKYKYGQGTTNHHPSAPVSSNTYHSNMYSHRQKVEENDDKYVNELNEKRDSKQMQLDDQSNNDISNNKQFYSRHIPDDYISKYRSNNNATTENINSSHSPVHTPIHTATLPSSKLSLPFSSMSLYGHSQNQNQTQNQSQSQANASTYIPYTQNREYIQKQVIQKEEKDLKPGYSDDNTKTDRETFKYNFKKYGSTNEMEKVERPMSTNSNQGFYNTRKNEEMKEIDIKKRLNQIRSQAGIEMNK